MLWLKCDLSTLGKRNGNIEEYFVTLNALSTAYALEKASVLECSFGTIHRIFGIYKEKKFEVKAEICIMDSESYWCWKYLCNFTCKVMEILRTEIKESLDIKDWFSPYFETSVK